MKLLQVSHGPVQSTASACRLILRGVSDMSDNKPHFVHHLFKPGRVFFSLCRLTGMMPHRSWKPKLSNETSLPSLGSTRKGRKRLEDLKLQIRALKCVGSVVSYCRKPSGTTTFLGELVVKLLHTTGFSWNALVAFA